MPRTSHARIGGASAARFGAWAGHGYPWTVIPVERRGACMAALEDASVRQDIGPFTDFLAELVREGLEGRALAGLPRRIVPGSVLAMPDCSDSPVGKWLAPYQPSQRYIAVDERHRWEADLSARNLMRAMVGLKRSRSVEDRSRWW